MDNILERLKTECFFPQVFEDWEWPENSWDRIPRKKIGHIRADYNGRWWNTVWPCHPELAAEEIRVEIDRVYESLTAGDALEDLSALKEFCFYLEGKNYDFWIRLITREMDYNLYLNAFTKR